MSENKRTTTWVEEIDIAGRDLVNCVTGLIYEGNVRRVILQDAAGTVLIELPLAAGVMVGGAAVIAAPVLAALGAMAALLTNCRVQVVRDDSTSADESAPDTVAPVSEAGEVSPPAK